LDAVNARNSANGGTDPNAHRVRAQEAEAHKDLAAGHGAKAARTKTGGAAGTSNGRDAKARSGRVRQQIRLAIADLRQNRGPGWRSRKLAARRGLSGPNLRQAQIAAGRGLSGLDLRQVQIAAGRGPSGLNLPQVLIAAGRGPSGLNLPQVLIAAGRGLSGLNLPQVLIAAGSANARKVAETGSARPPAVSRVGAASGARAEEDAALRVRRVIVAQGVRNPGRHDAKALLAKAASGAVLPVRRVIEGSRAVRPGRRAAKAPSVVAKNVPAHRVRVAAADSRGAGAAVHAQAAPADQPAIARAAAGPADALEAGREAGPAADANRKRIIPNGGSESRRFTFLSCSIALNPDLHFYK
jgi:hypothetical protein